MTHRHQSTSTASPISRGNAPRKETQSNTRRKKRSQNEDKEELVRTHPARTTVPKHHEKHSPRNTPETSHGVAVRKHVDWSLFRIPHKMTSDAASGTRPPPFERWRSVLFKDVPAAQIRPSVGLRRANRTSDDLLEFHCNGEGMALFSKKAAQLQHIIF